MKIMKRMCDTEVPDPFAPLILNSPRAPVSYSTSTLKNYNLRIIIKHGTR